MAWETPKTWSSEPLVSIDLNTHVRDNLNYLKGRVDATAKQYIRVSGDYTTTSTSLVDVDATNLSLTLDTTGNDVRVTFVGVANGTGGDRDISIAVDIDGTPYTILTAVEYAETNFSFSYVFTGLAAGSHTFKIQWKINSGTATLIGANLLFDVREEIGVVA